MKQNTMKPDYLTWLNVKKFNRRDFFLTSIVYISRKPIPSSMRFFSHVRHLGWQHLETSVSKLNTSSSAAWWKLPRLNPNASCVLFQQSQLLCFTEGSLHWDVEKQNKKKTSPKTSNRCRNVVQQLNRYPSCVVGDSYHSAKFLIQ